MMIDENTGRTIPGTVTPAGREYIYVSDDGSEYQKWFKRVTILSPEIRAKSGGVVSSNCRLRLPDGRSFFAMSYKGDLAGWRLGLQENARRLKLTCAFVDSDQLRVNDGSVFKLSECKVTFFTL